MDTGPIEKAFKSPKFRWRTIRGIHQETGIPEEVIRDYIRLSKGHIFKSAYTNQDGEELFTTKELFYRHASLKDRILAALRNKLD